MSPFLSLDLGAGLSVNYFDIDLHLSRFPIPDFHDSDWVFGGQFFADLNYNFQNWFVGIGVKYQLTQELALGTPGAPLDPGSSADNLRLGVKAGVMF